MNVFRSETTTNDDIENIKNDIVTCDADTNDDIVISFKGFKHNKSGFILRVTNIERLTDATGTLQIHRDRHKSKQETQVR